MSSEFRNFRVRSSTADEETVPERISQEKHEELYPNHTVILTMDIDHTKQIINFELNGKHTDVEIIEYLGDVRDYFIDLNRKRNER